MSYYTKLPKQGSGERIRGSNSQKRQRSINLKRSIGKLLNNDLSNQRDQGYDHTLKQDQYLHNMFKDQVRLENLR